MTLEFIIMLLCGFGAVFLGAAVYTAACRGRCALTNFQRFLFATGFAYMLFTVSELVRFLIDYFVPGSDLQRGGAPMEYSLWFCRIFGMGTGAEDRAAVYATDLRILAVVLGALLGGAALLALDELRSRRRGDGDGVLAGWRFPRQTPKAYFLEELRTLRREIPLPEYLSWWVVRGLMVWVIFRQHAAHGFTLDVMLLVVNTLATFVVPLAHLLFFAKLFLGRLPFRVQTCLNVFVFFGSFLWHGLEWRPTDYDKLLHVVSGGLAVVIGWLLINNTRGSEKLPAGVRAAASGCFSTVVMADWELFEFFADHYLNSNNQNLQYEPAEDMIFFRLFGRGAQNPTQVGLLDTGLDVFFAMAACILVTLALWLGAKAYHKRRLAKRETCEAVR